mgnify:CR=1 FL=1
MLSASGTVVTAVEKPSAKEKSGINVTAIPTRKGIKYGTASGNE